MRDEKRIFFKKLANILAKKNVGQTMQQLLNATPLKVLLYNFTVFAKLIEQNRSKF